jgi:D-alanyl-D-alanine carboxypeptidase/D-alanyl-D-alanine carboxypeptidase (penicillin-binding protein 5/6)
VRLVEGRFATALAATILAVSSIGAADHASAGYAAIVVDGATGRVLDEVNADQVNHPASLTKMMTLYLAFEALQKGRLHWDDQLHVSTFASEKSPTKLGLEPGSALAVRDCVLGMIVLSANDAATVMAEALGGSEENFARMMTAKARELGMTSTNFVNASGLPDEDQVTTARDLTRLEIALYQNFPNQYHYFSTREFTFRGRVIMGHNRLMYRYAGMDGLKTGYTASSGFNLASSAERNGRRLFAVVMGSESAPMRDRLMGTLLDDGFADRQTDPVLVAQAAGQDTRTAHRLLAGAERVMAALSPVSRAEAAPINAGLPPPRPAPARPAAAEASAPVERSGSTHWAVQVGAYGQQSLALLSAEKAAKLAGLSPHLAAVTQPAKGDRIFRARLVDLASEQQAREACQMLRRKGIACVLVAPGEPGIRLATARGK